MFLLVQSPRLIDRQYHAMTSRKQVEVGEAVKEALERWGEAAAVYRNRTRRRPDYEVGYFGRMGDGLMFHAMGQGASLEQALETACKAERIEFFRG